MGRAERQGRGERPRPREPRGWGCGGSAAAAVAVARAVGSAPPGGPGRGADARGGGRRLSPWAPGCWSGSPVSVLAHLPGAAGDLARRWAERTSPAVGASAWPRSWWAPACRVRWRRGRPRPTGRQPGTQRRVGSAAALGGRRGGTGAGSALPRAGSDEPLGDRHPVLPGLAPSSRTTPAPAPGWTPDRPSCARQASTRLVATSRRRRAPGVVVRAGATPCGTSSTPPRPGRQRRRGRAEWPRWHAANRDVIGHDPDLLLPGRSCRRRRPRRCGDDRPDDAAADPGAAHPPGAPRDHPAGAQCPGPGERDRRRATVRATSRTPSRSTSLGQRRAALRPPAHRPRRPARPGALGRPPRPGRRRGHGRCAPAAPDPAVDDARGVCRGGPPRQPCQPGAAWPARGGPWCAASGCASRPTGWPRRAPWCSTGPRVRALAMRLVGLDGRWRIEALQVG